MPFWSVSVLYGLSAQNYGCEDMTNTVADVKYLEKFSGLSVLPWVGDPGESL